MVLKRIAVSDLALGMFVHRMEGSWFRHPFWKARFLLDDPGRLERLHASDVDFVLIDTEKGLGIAAPATSGANAQALADNATPARPSRRPGSGIRVTALRSRQSVNLASVMPVATHAEIGAAQQVAANVRNGISQAFLQARLGKAINVRTIAPLVDQIHASIQRNPQAFGGLMRCKLKNECVYRHAIAVSALMIALARRMRLTAEDTFHAGLTGLLLDIGITELVAESVPADGQCRAFEPAKLPDHVLLAHRTLQSGDDMPWPVIEACLQHHERMDGSGFPQGLTGKEIVTLARMAGICDTFDLLLMPGAGGPGLDPAAAVLRLESMAAAFDPVILRAFIESVGGFPVGSFVRLRSDRLAMVIDTSPDDPYRPVVRTFYTLVSHQRIAPTIIELDRCGGQDAIIEAVSLDGLGLPPDDELREFIFLGAHKMGR